MNRAMGTTKEVGKTPLQLYTGSIHKIPVHSANGLYPYQVKPTITKDGVRYTVSPRGQKCENIMQVMKALFRHADDREPFEVCWSMSPKSAMEISHLDQATEEEYHAWLAKHRLFIIPSAHLILAERLIVYFSKLIEQNTEIKIGFKWPHGGADFLFKGYNLDSNTRFHDGDFSKLDQTIHQVLMRLFYSTRFQYNSATGPDASVMNWLIDQLVSHVTVRLTHLMEGLWARVTGEMPSGAWATSHGDSWRVLFLWYLFVSCTLAGMEDEEMLVEIERLFDERKIGIIVYGDDHVVILVAYVEEILGEPAFAQWVGTVWNMKIRDIRVGLSLLSEVRNGELVKGKEGVVFLKHYLIKCTLSIPNPPTMIPFRPKSQVAPRVVWGSVGDDRNAYDCLLTCLGLAYGLMGTNPDLHMWLSHFYSSLASSVKLDDKNAWAAAYDRFNFSKFRLYGLTKDVLKRGFPDLRKVQANNSVDFGYHTVNRDPFDVLERVVEWDD
jgi:hypothetical protein